MVKSLKYLDTLRSRARTAERNTGTSQGLSLRNPWIDSVDHASQRDARRNERLTSLVWSSLRDAIFLIIHQGFRRLNPGYVFTGSAVRALLRCGRLGLAEPARTRSLALPGASESRCYRLLNERLSFFVEDRELDFGGTEVRPKSLW